MLFKATKFEVICYSSSRILIYEITTYSSEMMLYYKDAQGNKGQEFQSQIFISCSNIQEQEHNQPRNLN